MAEPGRIRRELHDGVAILWMENGERNVLDHALLNGLAAALAECEADPDVRAVVLTGAGRTFCAGVDLSSGPTAIRDLLLGEGAGEVGYQEPAGRITLQMWRMSTPVIVAVNGDAVGGGATIPLAADVRFAAESARFGFPFTRLGLCPEGASTWFLPRLVGASRAADWLISGRIVDAQEALAAGLVSRVLPADEVLTAAHDYAGELVTRTSPAAVAATRALLAAGGGPDPWASAAAESAAIAKLVAAKDCTEGVAAFLERRPPRFEPSPRPPWSTDAAS
ncbi:enoyl-CoA hydratase-related protein [Microbispora siamensis]